MPGNWNWGLLFSHLWVFCSYLGFVQSEVKHFNTLSFNTQFVVFCVLSKNHRTGEVVRDLLRSSRSTHLRKQGQPGQVARDRVQWGCEYLQEWSLHNLSEHLCRYWSALIVRKVVFFTFRFHGISWFFNWLIFWFNWDFGQTTTSKMLGDTTA